jgi:hypothetical protein
MAGPRFSSLKPSKGGPLGSARSKTGDPQCSAAMSAWVRARHSGAAVAAEVFKILGMCRAKARALRMSKDHAIAGNDAKSQVWAKRADRGLSGAARNRLAAQKRDEHAEAIERRLKSAGPGAKAPAPRTGGRGALVGLESAESGGRSATRSDLAARLKSATLAEGRGTPERMAAALKLRMMRAGSAGRPAEVMRLDGRVRDLPDGGRSGAAATAYIERRGLDRKGALNPARKAAPKAAAAAPKAAGRGTEQRAARAAVLRAERKHGVEFRDQGTNIYAADLKLDGAHHHAAARARYAELKGKSTPETIKAARARHSAKRAAKANARAGQVEAAKPRADTGFSLKQESAVGKKAFGVSDLGRGKTGTMFDMKKGDLPGQTSLLERVGSSESNPRARRLERLGARTLTEQSDVTHLRAGRAAALRATREAQRRGGAGIGGGRPRLAPHTKNALQDARALRAGKLPHPGPETKALVERVRGRVAARKARAAAGAPRAFHEQVMAAAHAVPASGRYGGNKAFIGDVHAAHQADRRNPRMGLDAFKAKVLDHRDKLPLSRADLVSAMPADKVAKSSTKLFMFPPKNAHESPTAEYHFVRTKEGYSPNATDAARASRYSRTGAPESIHGELGRVRGLRAEELKSGRSEKRARAAQAANEAKRGIPGRGPSAAQLARHIPKIAGGSPMAVLERANATMAARAKTAARLRKVKPLSDLERAPEVHAKPGDYANVKTSAIHFDPERFQYKLAAAAGTGSVGSLSGVKKYDPELAGAVSVWRDPANGKTYVVNGHNRLDLAKKLNVDKVHVKYLDAPDATAARAKGAITNIAEGRGTSLDAGKFFRDTGISREHIAELGVPMREKVATEGLDLARLEPSLFRRTVDGEIPAARAAIIGGSGLSHAQQSALHGQLQSLGKRGEVSDRTLKELVDNARHAGSKTTKSTDLFGSHEDEQSLAISRAKVQATIKSELSRETKLFGLVSKSKAARELAEKGRSSIDTEATGKVSEEARGLLAVFDQLKNRSGPVAKALNNAAERIEIGHSEHTVIRETREQIAREIAEMFQPS